jgi:hypothetical protein
MTERIGDAIAVLNAAVQLAQWLPWIQLAGATVVAGGLGWGARMLREKQLRKAADEWAGLTSALD